MCIRDRASTLKFRVPLYGVPDVLFAYDITGFADVIDKVCGNHRPIDISGSPYGLLNEAAKTYEASSKSRFRKMEKALKKEKRARERSERRKKKG